MRALGHRDYRLFFAGQIVSLIGTWMQSVGQAWLVLELTNSPFKLGLLGTLQFGPMLLFAFLSGAIADRVRKRRLILAHPVRADAAGLRALGAGVDGTRAVLACGGARHALRPGHDAGHARAPVVHDRPGRQERPAGGHRAQLGGVQRRPRGRPRRGRPARRAVWGRSRVPAQRALVSRRHRRAPGDADRGRAAAPHRGPRCSKTSPRALATPRPRR